MARTFKNDGFLRDPDVAESPFLFACFKKHPARQARVISKNTDLVVVKGLDWVGSELTLVFLCCCRQHFVEVRVVFEGQTLFALEKAEVPHDFFRTRGLTEHL